MRIIFSTLLLLSLTLPLFQVKKNNSTDNAIEYLKDQLLDSNWGQIANQAIAFSEKMRQEKTESDKGIVSSVKHNIITGYGTGFSSIGAVVVAWNNYRFNRLDLVPIIPSFIILSVIIQLIFHQFLYRNRNAIFSIITMLLALSIFGNCIGHDNYSGYLLGIVVFILIQTSYMVYFYWVPYKKVKAQDSEIQPS